MAFGTKVFSSEYANFELKAKKLLNVSNLAKCSKSRMSRIGKALNNDDLFLIYKRNLLDMYIKEKNPKTKRKLNELKYIIKKMELNLSESDKDLIAVFEGRVLTNARPLKSLSYPFSESDERRNLKRRCFFSFEDCDLYSVTFLNITPLGNTSIYIFETQLVIYSPTSETIVYEIEFSDILRHTVNITGYNIKIKNRRLVIFNISSVRMYSLEFLMFLFVKVYLSLEIALVSDSL